MIPSTLRSERFNIQREIGAGGMGVVYEALDRRSGKAVALKTLRRSDGEALYGFKKEFRSLADIVHPNLVRLGELYCEGEHWYFTMELVRGTSFVEYVRREQEGRANLEPAAEERLRAALGQLAEALRTLHGAARVHRDIKPSNVLVTDAGRVVLLDFGLATEAHVAGRAPVPITKDVVVGTAAYMAPEQANVDQVGCEADCYAVGVLLFEALTGQLPFTGSALEMLREKGRRQAPSPRERFAGAPADLDALCAELLQREPRRRPTAAAIASRAVERHGPSRKTGEAPVGRAVEDDPASPFVGRDAELSRMRGALATARARPGGGILVMGEPGIGKTALVERFLEDARERDPSLVVLRGRCYEQESVPFKAFDGVVDALSHHLKTLDPIRSASLLPSGVHLLADLFPVLRRVPSIARAVPARRALGDSTAQRARGFDELKRLLAALADTAPLIVFVDDLQWIDEDSLALLHALASPVERPAMLLVATVRSNRGRDHEERRPESGRVDPGPDSLRALARGPEAFFDTLLVASLKDVECEVLVTKLRGASAAWSQEDAKAVIGEACGHPLFLAELVRFHDEGGAELPHMANLNDVLWRRIEALGAPMRRLVEVLATAKRPLPAAVAAGVADVPPEALADALAGLRHAHLVRSWTDGSRELLEPFHDRVREAIVQRLYDPSSADAIRAQASLHLRIGRALLEQEGGVPADDALFAIVDHVNQGAHLVTDARERHQLAALNLRAARRAREATALDVARASAEHGDRFLGPDGWETARETKLALGRELLEVHHVMRADDLARRDFDDTLAHATSHAERADLYILRVTLETARGEFAAAIATARAGLRELGVRLPEKGTTASMLTELASVRWSLGRRAVEQLASLTDSTDEKQRAAMRLLMSMAPAAYFSDRTLMSLVLLRMTRLSLRDGLTDCSAYGFLGYGLVLSGAFGDHARAYQFAQLAVRLNERFGNAELEAKIFHIAGYMIGGWVRPFAEGEASCVRAIEAGLRIGDYAYRSYAAGGRADLCALRAASLTEVLEVVAEGGRIAARHGETDMLAIATVRERVYGCLRELREAPADLSCAAESEKELAARLTDERTPMGKAYYHHYKAMLHYHFGATRQAYDHGKDVEVRVENLFSLPVLADFRLYQCLAAVDLGTTASLLERARLRHSASKALAQLRRWADACAENFEVRYLIAAAEHARTDRRYREADGAYDAALAWARRTGAWGMEGLALELQARSKADQGDAPGAERTRGMAVAAYRRYGAEGKAVFLEKRG